MEKEKDYSFEETVQSAITNVLMSYVAHTISETMKNNLLREIKEKVQDENFDVAIVDENGDFGVKYKINDREFTQTISSS